MMTDDFVYNNEDESDMGQLHGIHYHLNAIAAIQRELHTNKPSRTHCLDCAEPIPENRRQLVPGCVYCVHCKGKREIKR